MTVLDWTIVGLYLTASVVIGIVLTKKASRGTTDFFVAGRSLPWWIAGTSIVATTFSTDTPLYVAGLTRTDGMAENWWWWSLATGHVATVFFFARLWRRSGVLTEVQFIELRYDPGPVRTVLRIFRALFDGVLVNAIVLASVTWAAVIVLDILLGLSHQAPLMTLSNGFELQTTHLVLLVLAGFALAYSLLSGLMGVAYTDLIQFGLAMIGSIWLAVVAYLDAEKQGGFATSVTQAAEAQGVSVSLFPNFSQFDLLTFTFLVYLSISWWDRAPGRGYIIQRLLATKNERESMLAFLWFCICHYVLRAWPWIVVGLVSMLYFVDLPGSEAEKAYPLMIEKYLGPGMKGIMVAAMLAAYMSTVDTHLNWGASYLINDIYQPYLKPKQPAKHYVNASRVAMVALTLITLLTVPMLVDIKSAYKYLAVILTGSGTLMILRWYWWRVSAWSEVAAIICVLIVGNGCMIWLPDQTNADGVPQNYLGVRMLITVITVGITWVTVSLLTQKTPSKQTQAFYKKMRISGPGWRRVSQQMGIKPLGSRFRLSLLGWLTGCGLIYGALIGFGELIFQRWLTAGLCLTVCVVCTVLLLTVFRSVFAADEQEIGS